MTITFPCWVCASFDGIKDDGTVVCGSDGWFSPWEQVTGEPIESLAVLTGHIEYLETGEINNLTFVTDIEDARLHHASWLAARALAGLSNAKPAPVPRPEYAGYGLAWSYVNDILSYWKAP